MSRWRLMALCAAAALASSCATMLPLDEGIIVSLDRAIREASQSMKDNLEQGTTVAVLNFSSGSARFDDYVMQELTYALVNGGKLTVKEQKDLESIRKNIQKDFEGYANDAELISLSNEAVARVVILGDLYDLDDTYRFRIRAVDGERKTILATYAVDLSIGERKLRNLMSGKKPRKMELEPVASAHNPFVRYYEWSKDKARLMYMNVMRPSFAWGEGIGWGWEIVGISFSPLPYMSLGIDGSGFTFMLFNNEGVPDTVFSSWFPVQAGVLLPLAEHIDLVCYGVLNWLGFATKDGWLIGGKGLVGIIPGIKAGLLWNFENAGDFGLELSYKGYWLSGNRYVSTIGVGLNLVNFL